MFGPFETHLAILLTVLLRALRHARARRLSDNR